MNTKIKSLAVLAMFMVSIFVLPIATHAGDITLNDVNIWRVDIDDVEFVRATGTQNVGPVFAGEKMHIKVFWEAPENFTGSLEARINVELDDEEVESEFFTIKPGWEDSSSFFFSLPRDTDKGTYVLTIELEDDFGRRISPDAEFLLEVTNKRRTVDVFDVNFPQGLEVKAGQTFLASVGVKNLGDVTEEDMQISISIPKLGLYQKSKKFDLFTEECLDEDRNECNDDDDEFKEYRDLFITIPSSTISGVYDLLVKVSYDDGDRSEEQVYSLVVGEGVSPGNALISVSTKEQTFAQGSGAVYTVMFPVSENYNIVVEGVDNFGTYMVNKAAGEAQIFVSAKENVASGIYPFTVKVLAGSSTVKQFDLTANVTSFKGSTADIKEGLQIGFAVLLVILIILGIILAARKIGKSDNYEDTLDESETYY